MTRGSAATLVALVMLSGCAGTRLPKLAKCTGPYRYANTYGTVLPSLPIPGQPAPPKTIPPASDTHASPAPPDAQGAPATELSTTTPPRSADPSIRPGKTSALLPASPSC